MQSTTESLESKLKQEKQAWAQELTSTTQTLEQKLKAEQSSWQNEMQMLRVQMQEQSDKNAILNRGVSKKRRPVPVIAILILGS